MGSDDGVTRFRLTPSFHHETIFIAPQELSFRKVDPMLFSVDLRLPLVELKLHKGIIMDPVLQSR